MDTQQIDQYCRLGEKADQLLREGRTRDALKTYEEILSGIEKGHIDSYLMAKVSLGVLRCQVKLGEFKEAYKVWNSGLEDSLHGIGIYALESAQTTVKDMVTYDMLCAFLHSLSAGDKTEMALAINQYMSRVCEHAKEQGDRDLMRLAVSNWKQHLKEVFKTSLPHEFAVELIAFERELSETVKPRPIDFPLPAAWEKPSDFFEMSRVVQMKAGERPPVPVPHARSRKQHAG
jgi:hypothetical protein